MKRYQRIKDLREDMDLTQAQISEKLNMHKTQYCRYENSTGNSFFEAMIQLSKFHNVSLDYIAGLTNNKGGLHKNSKLENQVLSLFNGLNDIRKGRVLQLLEMLAEEQEEENSAE